MTKKLPLYLAAFTALLVSFAISSEKDRPNILFCISDDQSFPHASAYGYEAISTPAFDRVADSGVLFMNGFAPSAGCSPTRAAFLTGRYIWQIEHAGTHASKFLPKYKTYQQMLETAGYWIGYTGKGWGPGDWRDSGREQNPAGPVFSTHYMETEPEIAPNDYATNFADFLDQRPEGKPFSFWFGAKEPHRSFDPGIGERNGIDFSKIVVPPFLPDTPEIREDLADYLYEIQWFDMHLGRMLDELEKRGELENTLIIITSDNGMAFPYAKANMVEYGIHMPLAVAWPKKIPGGRTALDVVNLIDLTATIYEATGVAPPTQYPLSGKSLLTALMSQADGQLDPSNDATFSGRERHSSVRYNSLGYPQRCIRTHEYLYVLNLRPERWPAGAPQTYGAGNYATDEEIQNKILGKMHHAYEDIDDSPAKTLLTITGREDPTIRPFFELAVGMRPERQLFNIVDDPGCLNNLADDPAYAEIVANLHKRLIKKLAETDDPRIVDIDQGDIFETYLRYSSLRWFPKPDWLIKNPDALPEQPWLERRRGSARREFE